MKNIRKLVLAKPKPTKTAKEIARELATALREAVVDPETGLVTASTRVNGGTVTITLRAKLLDKTTDSDHHRHTARPGAAQKDIDMPTKKNTKTATKKTTKRVTAKKVVAGKLPRVAKTVKKATKKRATKRVAKSIA
jgi:hypothetical protein